jgi:hypothetical protein
MSDTSNLTWESNTPTPYLRYRLNGTGEKVLQQAFTVSRDGFIGHLWRDILIDLEAQEPES